MLFYPRKVEDVSRARALSLFKRVEPSQDAYKYNGDHNDVPDSSCISREEYIAVINTAKRFHLLVDSIIIGASFRMGARMLQMFKENCGMFVYGGCGDTVASNYARVACAHSLQIISDCLYSSKVWTFSIAVDSSTHQSRSYPDVRARVSVESAIENLHLLSILFFDRHTGDLMFTTTNKFLDALYPHWKKTLLAVSSDGDRSIKGRIKGLLTRIDAFTVRVGLHQLDLVIQKVYKKFIGDDFMGSLTSLIGRLRPQKNLIQ